PSRSPLFPYTTLFRSQNGLVHLRVACISERLRLPPSLHQRRSDLLRAIHIIKAQLLCTSNFPFTTLVQSLHQCEGITLVNEEASQHHAVRNTLNVMLEPSQSAKTPAIHHHP